MINQTFRLAALAFWAAGTAEAGTAICTLQTGIASPVSEPCGLSLFVASQFIDWGAPVASGGLGQATSSPTSGNLNVTTSSGLGVTVTSPNDLLQRVDNTLYAWDNSFAAWLPADFEYQLQTGGSAGTVNTFGGQFGAPTGPTPTPQYGDNLLAAIAPQGPAVGPASLVLTFTQNISFAEFQVSSRSGSNSNFNAILYACAGINCGPADSQLLGAYMVSANGLGGLCTSLNNPGTPPYTNPQACNDAPLIQFYDPQGRIKSVYLQVSDLQGAYIDTLQLSTDVIGGVPEPSTGAMFMTALVCLIYFSQRYRNRRRFDE